MKEFKGLYVLRAHMETTEDKYEEGEQPDSNMLVWNEANLGPFADGAALMAYFGRNPPYVPEQRDYWSVSDPGSSSPEVCAEWTVDEDNNTAEPEQVERWKAGELRLWTARLTLKVVVVTGSHEPTVKELAQLTGFEEG